MTRPDYLDRNREVWDGLESDYVEPGRRNWAGEPQWGIWGVPEAELGLLPELEDKDVLEAGCGTAYLSAWLAQRGARPLGMDNSRGQLASARTFQGEFGIEFPLVHAAAEAMPFRDESFDLVISEYGAAIWSDPHLWIPEAARVLRPGGELISFGNSVLLMLCVPDEEGSPAQRWLRRDYFGIHRFEWPDSNSVEFHLGHGDMIRLLRSSGFEIEDLIEVRPAADAVTRYDFATIEWARSWPTEEAWRARKMGSVS